MILNKSITVLRACMSIWLLVEGEKSPTRSTSSLQSKDTFTWHSYYTRSTYSLLPLENTILFSTIGMNCYLFFFCIRIETINLSYYLKLKNFPSFNCISSFRANIIIIDFKLKRQKFVNFHSLKSKQLG